MPKAAQAASFEEFLKAPSRLQEQEGVDVDGVGKADRRIAQKKPTSQCGSKRPQASSRKEKVGLTIDPDIIDAIDDYIYHERKQGRRLKKNDVYEAALRQFLGLEGGDAR